MSALLLLLLQVVVILCVTSVCGWLARRMAQPLVVGQIFGGILLGPVALGALFPHASAFLFPATRLHWLDAVSNIGLVLFLFLIGAELDLSQIKKHRSATLAITIGSIALPFVFGLFVAPLLTKHFATGNVDISFNIFIAVAMSITALPVLAGILKDREEAHRPVSPVAAAHSLLSSAINDALVWCLLAVTLTVRHRVQGFTAALLPLAWLSLFTAVMLFFVRPLAKRSLPHAPQWLQLVGAVAIAFLSARVTDALGIHAFFGAFLAGLCMPRIGSFHTLLNKTLQPVIAATLPLFFALSGLKMQLAMFSAEGLRWLAIILVAAVFGKIGGGIFSARLSRMSWPVSREIGILLNTRGLVELIVLNIGYREGILNPALFTLFVLMAVLTTAMTVPLLLINSPRR